MGSIRSPTSPPGSAGSAPPPKTPPTNSCRIFGGRQTCQPSRRRLPDSHRDHWLRGGRRQSDGYEPKERFHADSPALPPVRTRAVRFYTGTSLSPGRQGACCTSPTMLVPPLARLPLTALLRNTSRRRFCPPLPS